MRSLFMAATFFCVAAVGYQLVKIDPMPIGLPSGGGGSVFSGLAGSPAGSPTTKAPTRSAGLVAARDATRKPVQTPVTLEDRMARDWDRWTPELPARNAVARVVPKPPSRKPAVKTGVDSAGVRHAAKSSSVVSRSLITGSLVATGQGTGNDVVVASQPDDGLPALVRIDAASNSDGVQGQPPVEGQRMASTARIRDVGYSGQPSASTIPLPVHRPVGLSGSSTGSDGGIATAALSDDGLRGEAVKRRAVQERRTQPKRNRSTSTERARKSTRGVSSSERKKRRAKAAKKTKAKLRKKKSRRTASKKRSRKPL
ncbi:MAG: hypothetical protein AAFV69_14990, partial [Pseudomonadota bacterium]